MKLYSHATCRDALLVSQNDALGEGTCMTNILTRSLEFSWMENCTPDNTETVEGNIVLTEMKIFDSQNCANEIATITNESYDLGSTFV